ncbi:hypothetical protein DMN91_011712 [Ooceraea biroi]|uniref:Uncharacterized protein n=1 Tax=Ooceraea biroi TaxID=2015173 RepID=A0A3L8D6S3_OOCBI|nr:hypothetical protein DMN91_011712 [Ooceraea biroi]
MTSFEEVQHLLKSILVVALSQEIGKREDNTYLESEIHLRYINTVIKGSTSDIEETTNEEETEFQKEEEEDEDSITSWTHWTESIIEDAKIIASKSQGGDNIYKATIVELITEAETLGIDASGTIDDLRKHLSTFVSENPRMFPATSDRTKVPGPSATAEAPINAMPENPAKSMNQIRKCGCHFDGKDPVAFLERIEELKHGYGFSDQ